MQTWHFQTILTSQAVNEAVILQLKDGVNLENLAFDVDSSPGRAMFVQL
jgi:hypothetical protein